MSGLAATKSLRRRRTDLSGTVTVMYVKYPGQPRWPVKNQVQAQTTWWNWARPEDLKATNAASLTEPFAGYQVVPDVVVDGFAEGR